MIRVIAICKDCLGHVLQRNPQRRKHAGLDKRGTRFPVDTRDFLPSLLAVSSRLLKWLAVLSLIFVLGGHWAVLQSVAWVTMLAGYSQAAPLKEALVSTFDGKHPCPICKFVAKGKKSEQKQETQRTLIKLDLFVISSPVALCPPDRFPVHFASPGFSGARSEIPPTPPPRNFPG